MKKILFLFMIFYLHASVPSAMVDYRMDKCSWDNDSNTYEIKSFGNNDYNATSINGADTIGDVNNKGIICRAGDFNAPKQIMPKTKISLRKKYSVSLWIKFPLNRKNHKAKKYSAWFNNSTKDWKKNHYYEYYNIADIDGSDDDFIFFRYDKTDNYWSWCVDTKSSLFGDGLPYCRDFTMPSGWKMVTFVNDSSDTYLYINEKKIDSISYSLQNLKLDRVGASDLYDNNDGNTTLGSYIDEFKIFKTDLSSDDITNIYNNEIDKRNYDGTKRTYKCCSRNYTGEVTPIEMEGGTIKLNNTYDNPTWNHVKFDMKFSTTPVVFMVINTAGTNPASVRIKNVTTTGFDVTIVEPEGEDGPHISQDLNYIAVNKGVHKLGNNYIEVGEISTDKVQGKYTNGNKGWTEIQPRVYFCDPVVITNIQTLNNEQNSIPTQTSKPWMNAVVENNSTGIYVALDRSETNDGSVSSTEKIGYMIGLANIQDSFVDNNSKNIRFETIKTEPYFVGWDDECKKVSFVNSYANTPIIAGWKNSRRGGDGGWFRRCYLDNKEIGFEIDEDRAYDTERSHVPEKGGIFVFSDNFILNDNPVTNIHFSIQELNRDDDNITTKIVNNEFSLKIIADNSFNGTVCSTVVDTNDNNVSAWYKNYFDNVDNSTDTDQNDPTYTVNKALKNAKIKIVWLKSDNVDCPISDETNDTLSEDGFAIRPKVFDISNYPSTIYAAENFNITFHALDNIGSNALDYNETNNSTFSVIYQDLKSECTGKLDISVNFINGTNTTIANYNNVGEVNLTIKDNGFANIDIDDTSDEQRLIPSKSVILKINPYKIEFNTTFAESNITYMDKDLNTNYSKFITNIQVLDAKGNLIPDYNSTCYAKDINISYTTKQNLVPETFIGLYNDMNDTNFQRWDSNWTIPADLFKNGETNVTVLFNIYKDYSKPISIKDINFTKLSIETPNLFKIEQNETLDKNISFFYAKVLTKDMYTELLPTVQQKLQVIVYDKNNNHFRIHKLINWYLNTMYDKDDITILGNMKDYIYKVGEDVVGFESNLTKNIYEYNLSMKNTGNNKFVVIHLKTPYYLWYSRYNDYNDSDNSGCLSHYCVEYHFKLNSSSQATVGSGKFIGSEVNNTRNIPRVKKGIKIYR